MEVPTIIQAAKDYAAEAVAKHQFTDVQKMSNGSEAWQAVSITTKNLRKLQNQLKKIEDVRHDSYWGYLVSAPLNNFYFEEVWTEAFADYLRQNGIGAHRVERLL